MLKRIARSALRRGANAVGYQTRDTYPDEPSSDYMRDIDLLLGEVERPVLFDVGANIGHTIENYLRHFPTAEIHSFEPGRSAYEALARQYCGKARLNNLAVSDEVASKEFYENSKPLMSSFSKLGPEGWGEAKLTTVQTTTLDQYCTDSRVQKVDLLKIDTQGHELEVLRGAKQTLQNTKLVFLEITLHKLYENLPTMGQVMDAMTANGFELVNFYDFNYKRFRLGWMDALFAKA